ncbi:HIT family protein [Candidatus Peregrinibacteria bacterium]|nr:MAG: HIT family protein [Candidatus Peregrinibacteria bacterium]
MTCIFCQIIERKIPSSIVYEDDTVLAFMDIQPVNPGHVLVIPKKHAESVAELDDETMGALNVVCKKVNQALRKSDLKVEGVNHFLADGEAAGQEVFHVHFHVFPRFANDGFGLKFKEDYANLPPRSELDAAAGKIKKNC